MGPTLILDEEMPAGHHLVQPASASSGMPGQEAAGDVPMAEPPRLSELGGGSFQLLGGDSALTRGNTQPLGGETTVPKKPAKPKPRVKTLVKPPTRPKPDESLWFELDPFQGLLNVKKTLQCLKKMVKCLKKSMKC